MNRPIVLPELPDRDESGAPDGWGAFDRDDMEAYARAAVEADRAGIAAVLLDIYKAAGGDSECTPDPSPEEVLACVRDLRECYDDALTWVPPSFITAARLRGAK